MEKLKKERIKKATIHKQNKENTSYIQKSNEEKLEKQRIEIEAHLKKADVLRDKILKERQEKLKENVNRRNQYITNTISNKNELIIADRRQKKFTLAQQHKLLERSLELKLPLELNQSNLQ